MLNQVTLIGNLTEEPELKSTESGTARSTFTVAVSRKYRSNGEMQEETTFVPITTWREQAQNCATYLEKGRLVAVTGRLRISNYEDDEGITRKWVNVEADNVHFLDFAGDGGDSGSDDSSGGSTEPQPDDDDEEIPF